MAQDDDKIPICIPEFYKERSVFVTGFTGYLGKLIVEKLLYSCPEVNNIYVLVRPKRGQNARERFEATTMSKAFLRLKEKYPGVMESKIIPISGDIQEDKLGISNEDEEVLRREVSVIFHSAASIKFDDPLKFAVEQNSLATKKMLDLALTMPNLKSFVYISTAYSNCDHQYIKEKVYPPKANWRDLRKICEKVETATLQVLTDKYIGEMPNTYVFTKSISEQIINEYRDRLPVAVVRPSVVIPAWKEPVSGWTDNKYGVVAYLIGFVLGIVRCTLVDVTKICNFIHSDMVVNSSIIVSWKTAMKYNPNVIPDSVAVYNSCMPLEHTITQGAFSEIYRERDTMKLLKRNNMDFVCLQLHSNEFLYRINVLMRHLLPAAFIDLILVLAKKKPILVNIRRKVSVASYALKYFTLRTFLFENDNFSNLVNDLRPEDKGTFGWNYEGYDIVYIYDRAFEVCGFTLLKPLYDDFQTNRKRLYMLYLVDRGAIMLTYSLIAYLIYAFSIPQALLSFLTSLVYF